jgi:HEAT repeat protein
MLKPLLEARWKSVTLLFLALLFVPGATSPSRGAAPDAALADLGRALAAKDFAALEKAIQAIRPEAERKAAARVIRTRLKDPDGRVRRLAAYALSQCNPEEARKEIAALVEALRDDVPRVRARVALALAEIGPEARGAVPTLRKLLHDADPRVRAGAVRALGAIGGEVAPTLPRLLELLKDREAPVRALTALTLAQLGPSAPEAVAALDAMRATDPDAEVRAAAAATLEGIDPPLPVLVAALTSPDPGRRLWAVAGLARKGPAAKAATAKLAAAVKYDAAAPVRAGAAYALGKIGPAARRACPVLIRALKDPAARVRTAAALVLGLLGPEAHGAGRALAAALRDEDAEVAAAAATALGNLGPESRAAVPLLIEQQRQKDLMLRRRAVHVLAGLGPAARGAAAVLRECLGDADPVVRRDAARALVSVGPQATAPVSSLIEMLHLTEKDLDRHVRAWACLSLGQCGPRAHRAVPPLIAALQDGDPNVYAAAVLALGGIGAPAVPRLVGALDHLDGRVRAGAARALGAIGAGARRALADLRAALRDDEPAVCLAAAEALGQIAGGLQLAQETAALGALEEALQDLEKAGKTRPVLEREARWQAAAVQLRQAIGALQTVRRARFLDRILHHPWFPWLAGGLLYAGIMLGFWSVLLWLRPLLLLRVNDALGRLPQLRLLGPLGGLEISLRGFLLVGFFHYRRRVLDAWVARHAECFRQNYLAKRTVADRRVYVSVPVVLDGKVVPCPGPRQLGQAFARQRGCLLIWGEGGAGKTALACEVGRWALAADRSERLCEHLMLPVLIEHELDVPAGDKQPAFRPLTEAVRGQLQTLTGAAAPLSEELLDRLLRRRRILVIVDHFSEAGAAARAAVRPGQPDFPAHALVVTSRGEEALDGVPTSVVQPLRIEGNRLSSFMEAYLVRRGQRQLFDDAEYFEGCRRLSLLAGSGEITSLLAKLYAEQMIARKQHWPQGALPTNLPDLILGYVNELNRTVAPDQRRGDFEVQRDAQALAWECLRHTLRPGAAGREAALKALGGADARTRLDYLEVQLRIIRAAEPAQDRVAFTLDPLAEYLAALRLVAQHRNDAGFWRALVARTTARPEERDAVPGLVRALRECCLARNDAAAVLKLLDERVSRAA